MPDRPPSPSPSPTAPSAAPSPVGDPDDRTLATTGQLAGALEESYGIALEEERLEALLLELDRRDYVAWVTVTASGDYVWDLTESADRIAEAVAELVVDRLTAWLAGDGTVGDA